MICDIVRYDVRSDWETVRVGKGRKGRLEVGRGSLLGGISGGNLVFHPSRLGLALPNMTSPFFLSSSSDHPQYDPSLQRG